MTVLASETKCSPAMSPKVVIGLVILPLVFLSAALLQGDLLWSKTSFILGADHVDSDSTLADPWSTVTDSITSEEAACLSRAQHMLHRPPSHVVPINAALVSAFAKYEEHHAECYRSVGGNWTEWYSRTVEGSSTECKFLVYMEQGVGLGNRLISVVTAFVYAMLTNRILLVDNSYWAGHVGALMCEPFASSSWRLPVEEKFPYRILGTEAPGLAEAMVADFKDMKVVRLSLQQWQTAEESQFFCAETRERFQSVPWVTWHSNQYFLPRLFTFPEYWPELTRLFPDPSLAFTYVSRLLLLPNNAIWERVFRVQASYLASAEKVVGVQIRRHWVEDSGNFSRVAFKRVLQCLVEHDILPALENSTSSDHDPKSTEPKSLPAEQLLQMMDLRSEPRGPPAEDVLRTGGAVTAVLIASLQRKYVDELQDLYTNSATTDGSLVRVHMVTHEGVEQFSYDQSEKAFVEMWLLSLSNHLATSAYSTFGYVAQGLGAMRPYMLDLRGDIQDDGTSCLVGQSPEPCDHYSFWPKDDCGNASALTPAHEEWLQKYLGHCQDLPSGIQLLPSSSI